MGHTIVAEKLKDGAPDLLVRPNIGIFRMLDFFQASAILRAAEPVKAEVKEKLGAAVVDCSREADSPPDRCAERAHRRLEEIPQQRRRFALADAAIDLRPVMAGRRREEAHAVLHRAALRIGGAVVEPADARKRDRRRAHGAGLERHVEIAVGQPLRAERGGRLPDRQHLGMRGRVAVAQGAVAGARDHRTVAHDHAADRHLAGGAARAACASASASSMKDCCPA